MEKQSPNHGLEALRDYFAGEGDEATRREIRRELDTPGSDLRKFVDQIGQASREWLEAQEKRGKNRE